MPAQPLFELSGVSKLFKNRGEKIHVLADVTTTIRRGDFIAVMGPSGSGKSTFLNLLGGLDRATSGEIRFGSHLLGKMGESALAKWRARNIGFVFQSYNLIPILTALQNVEIPLLLTSLSKTDRRSHAKLALELVGLADRMNHHPRKLSGGQQQRLAVARAIVSDPSVLLCDEPTGNLDRPTANDLLELLRQMNKRQGKTVVMATHDPAAAEYASSVWSLDKGILAGAGP